MKMNERPIEDQQLINDLRERAKAMDFSIKWLVSELVKRYEKAIERDTVEVVHGRWVNITDFGDGNCYGFCSVCGTDQPASSATALRINHKYCRWCGAKMDT